MPRSSLALQGAATPAGAPSDHLSGWSSSGAVLSAVVVAVTVLLLLLFYYFAWRVFWPARGSSGDDPPRPATNGDAPPHFSQTESKVSPAALASLPTFVYAAAGDEGLECSVCLTELEEGEIGRRLPRCGHRFHAECIDVWLRSHSSCPLCRSTIESKLPSVSN